MTKILRSVVFALLPVCITVGAAEVSFRNSELFERFRYSSWFHCRPRFYAEELDFDPEVLIMGDSRTLHGVRPTVVEAVAAREGLRTRMFNLGLPGATPVTFLGWVDYALGRVHPPKLVILTISPHMFSTKVHRPTAWEAVPTFYTPRGAYYGLLAGMPLEDVAGVLFSSQLELIRFRRGIVKYLTTDWGGPVGRHGNGEQGWTRAGSAPGNVQRARARGRAREWQRNHIGRPGAELDPGMLALLRATIERFQERGTKVVLVTAPVASELVRLQRDDTIYDEVLERIVALATELHVPFRHHLEEQPLADHYFGDGDHPSSAGALRYSVYLAQDVVIPALGGRERARFERFSDPEPSPGCRIVFDFEEVEAHGWQLSGDAFAPGLVTDHVGAEPSIVGYRGYQHLGSWHPTSGRAAIGMALSPPLTVDRPSLALLLAGDASPNVRVELVIDDAVVRTALPSGSTSMREVRWDVSELVGRIGRLRVVDERGPRPAAVSLDHVELCGAR